MGLGSLVVCCIGVLQMSYDGTPVLSSGSTADYPLSCLLRLVQAAAETGGFEVAGQHATAEMRKPRRGRRERATVPEGTSTRSDFYFLFIYFCEVIT